MKEFMLLFRQPSFDYSKAKPEEMQALSKKWKDWADGISSQGKLVSNGNRLSLEGKVLKPGGVITDGPFVETKEQLDFLRQHGSEQYQGYIFSKPLPALEIVAQLQRKPSVE